MSIDPVPLAILQGTSTLGMMLLATGLFGRPFCFRRQLTVREARMTRYADFAFWVGAVVSATASVLIWLSRPQSEVQINSGNPFPMIQLLFFVAILGLDIWPARRFRSWSRYLDLDQVPYFTDREYAAIRRIWKIQSILLLPMPFFSPLIHAGIGISK